MDTDRIYAESIVNEYSKKEVSKTLALRKLDRKVKNPPLVLAYVLGSVFALVFGTGFCFAMGQLSFNISSDVPYDMIIGSVIGVVGIIGCVVNYFVYKKFLNSRKEKYAFEIITLAKEVAGESTEEAPAEENKEAK